MKFLIPLIIANIVFCLQSILLESGYQTTTFTSSASKYAKLLPDRVASTLSCFDSFFLSAVSVVTYSYTPANYKGYDLIDICFNLSGVLFLSFLGTLFTDAHCANLERVKETFSSVYPSPAFLFGIGLVNCFNEMTFEHCLIINIRSSLCRIPFFTSFLSRSPFFADFQLC